MAGKRRDNKGKEKGREKEEEKGERGRCLRGERTETVYVQRTFPLPPNFFLPLGKVNGQNLTNARRARLQPFTYMPSGHQYLVNNDSNVPKDSNITHILPRNAK